jgi:hypothetical protein
MPDASHPFDRLIPREVTTSPPSSDTLQVDNLPGDLARAAMDVLLSDLAPTSATRPPRRRHYKIPTALVLRGSTALPS